MKRSTFFLAIILLAFIASPFPAGAASEGPEENHILFILDSSGSMWGKMDGSRKIDVAKEVMSAMVGDLPLEANVGLMAFGHRRKEDCGDIELINPPGRENRRAIVGTIQSLKPKGKTPISRAIHNAASRLKEKEGRRTIVLVSDGEETCAPDPIGDVKRLRASGIEVIVHVVGFGVNKKQRAQLQAIADAGGGSYYNAETAGQFRDVMMVQLKPIVSFRPLPPGGPSWRISTPVEPDTYRSVRRLGKGTVKYYQFPEVRPGQGAQVMVSTTEIPSGRPYAGVALYLEDGSKIASNVIIGDVGKRKYVWLCTSAERGAYKPIFSVGNTYDKNATNALYQVSVFDCSDAGKGTDAGGGFENALAVEPNKTYKSYLTAEGSGGDPVDTYVISSVPKGATVSVKVVPKEDAQYGLFIYDQDRRQQKWLGGRGKGAIHRLKWAPKEEQEEVFVRVKSVAGNKGGRWYSMTVKVK